MEDINRSTNVIISMIHVMLTNKHQGFPIKSREFHNLLIGYHIQLVKNCKARELVP